MIDTDPTGLVPWLLKFIDATKSPEGLWFICDVIAQDKDQRAAYCTPEALKTLRQAASLQRDRLAEAEHKQAIDSRAEAQA